MMSENQQIQSSSMDRGRQRIAWLSMPICLAILFGTSLLLGIYCIKINQLLYQQNPPIYDSVSYYEKLHRVMSVTRSHGIAEGMREACFNATTVCGPFIIASLISPFVEPSRSIGTWIQVAELLIFVSSLFYYLTRVEGLRNSTSLFACLALFSLKCLFYTNGGLSDFRMDLSLMLMYGATSIWLLTALRQPSPRHFVMLGLMAGVTCLFRATAPIYFLCAMMPVCAAYLWMRSERGRLFSGLIVATAITTLTCGWFYILNFDFLYYYYVVWNTDANANVEFAESFIHVNRVLKHSGVASLVLIGAIAIWLICHRAWQRSGSSVAECFRRCRWEWLWLGVAPVLLLILRRTGANAFVSMPAVVGPLVFALIFFGKSVEVRDAKSIPAFLWLFLAVCIAGNATRGYQKHRYPDWVSMDAHQQIIDTIVGDARREHRAQAAFGTLQLTDLTTVSLYGAILFDRHDVDVDGHHARIGQVGMVPVHTFAVAARADWAEIEGTTTAEKIESLCLSATAWMDYLLIPDPKSKRAMPQAFQGSVINRYIPQVTDQLLSAECWVPIGPVVSGEHDMRYQLYKNIRGRKLRTAMRRLYKPTYSNDVGFIKTGNRADLVSPFALR